MGLGVGARANAGSGVGLGQMQGQDLVRSCTPGPPLPLPYTQPHLCLSPISGPAFALALHLASHLPKPYTECELGAMLQYLHIYGYMQPISLYKVHFKNVS